MSEVKKLCKGLDIRLSGRAETVFGQTPVATLYALKPTDFQGLKPKLSVKEGDAVEAGAPLLYDKTRPEIKLVSPVSGTVQSIVRGERRRIEAVVVKSSGPATAAEVGKLDPATATAEQVVEKLLATGAWAYLKQRPYNIVADPARKPKAIYISTFDTAPLAPDYDTVIRGNEAAFQAGVTALGKIAPVFVGISSKGASRAFSEVKGATVTAFAGKHPAGCVGVQINHTCPLNAGETILTAQVQEVVAIGKIFAEGKHDFSRIVVLDGSEVKRPAYYHTVLGAELKPLLEGAINANDVRIISGNPLTGTKVALDGFLGFFDSQVTVLPEGDKPEFLGWLMPGLGKFSMSRTFLTWLSGKKEYRLDTNTHGEPRAIVVSGEMEKVLPMDIYPEHLLKAILAKDIDKMIELGIYEVVEEDMALCEFVSTSKLPVQRILRNGLNLMMEEVG